MQPGKSRGSRLGAQRGLDGWGATENYKLFICLKVLNGRVWERY